MDTTAPPTPRQIYDKAAAGDPFRREMLAAGIEAFKASGGPAVFSFRGVSCGADRGPDKDVTHTR